MKSNTTVNDLYGLARDYNPDERFINDIVTRGRALLFDAETIAHGPFEIDPKARADFERDLSDFLKIAGGCMEREFLGLATGTSVDMLCAAVLSDDVERRAWAGNRATHGLFCMDCILGGGGAEEPAPKPAAGQRPARMLTPESQRKLFDLGMKACRFAAENGDQDLALSGAEALHGDTKDAGIVGVCIAYTVSSFMRDEFAEAVKSHTVPGMGAPLCRDAAGILVAAAELFDAIDPEHTGVTR